jgi:hypothetical protein
MKMIAQCSLQTDSGRVQTAWLDYDRELRVGDRVKFDEVCESCGQPGPWWTIKEMFTPEQRMKITGVPDEVLTPSYWEHPQYFGIRPERER